jgi:hypothetical protein
MTRDVLTPADLRREEQAIVDVEALLVFAIRPGDNVGGPQQRRIGDAAPPLSPRPSHTLKILR